MIKLAVITNAALQREFCLLQPAPLAVSFVDNPAAVAADSSVVFDLLFEHSAERISLLKKFLPRPVFINAVDDTLAAIGAPFIRINAWPTFLKRPVMEIAARPEQLQIVQEVFAGLGWKYMAVPDLTGMITARITGMLINEAYHTLAGGVSTKADIDTAMKLGANYPYGPFEWGEKIGLHHIYTLLTKLAEGNKVYEVAALLKDELPLPQQ